jgi:hypothetical protein
MLLSVGTLDCSIMAAAIELCNLKGSVLGNIMLSIGIALCSSSFVNNRVGFEVGEASALNSCCKVLWTLIPQEGTLNKGHTKCSCMSAAMFVPRAKILGDKNKT